MHIDLNECSTNNGGCSSAASCSNTLGSYTCSCYSGYNGDGFTCNGMLITGCCCCSVISA